MSMPSGKAASLSRLLGWSSIVLSFGFVGLQLWRHAPWQLAAEHLQPLAINIAIGSLVYGLAGLLLSTAWRQLLGPGISTAPIRCYHAIYGRTQIAKYLPGNLFHFVGRQVMGRRLGYGQARLALASLQEAVLLVLVAGGLALPMVWRWVDGASLWLLGVAALAIVVIGSRLLPKQILAVEKLGNSADWPRSGAMLPVMLRILYAGSLYAGFFAVIAAIFWTLSLTVAGYRPQSLDLATSVSVVALAWVTGFVTPGSSAGIGVREAVLIAALEGSLGVEASALTAIALRLVSICGDVIFFAGSMAVSPSAGSTKPTISATS